MITVRLSHPSQSTQRNETVLRKRCGDRESEDRTHFRSFTNSTQSNKVFWCSSSSPFPGNKQSQQLKSVLVNLPFGSKQICCSKLCCALRNCQSLQILVHLSRDKNKQENKQKQKPTIKYIEKDCPHKRTYFNRKKMTYFTCQVNITCL